MTMERRDAIWKPVRNAATFCRSGVVRGVGAFAIVAMCCASYGAGASATMSTPTVFIDRGSDADALQRLVLLNALPRAAFDEPGELRASVHALYSARSFRPLWLTASGKPTAAAIKTIAALDSADRRGLDAHDYSDLAWSERLPALQAGAGRPWRARFDLALTVHALRLATHLHRGRIDPGTLKLGIDITTKRLNLPALAETLASASEPARVLAQLEPAGSGYKRLQTALDQYLSLQRVFKDGDLPPLPDMPLEPGDDYTGYAELHARLRALGDLVDVERDNFVGPPAPRYEGRLVTAVQRFQARHGLEVDGRIGAQTLMALNTPLGQRIAQIRMALERWRWLPSAGGEAPIVVNIADFQLRAISDDGLSTLEMAVVVGRSARMQTPVFVESLRAIVFQPSWSVPLSIVRGELLPRAAREPAYFTEQGFEIVGQDDQTLTAETIASLKMGRLALRQRPGPANALGRIKFLLPNRYSVYLHDTPSTAVFSRTRRDLSHGCIRVQDPEALANWVLRNQPEWTEQRIRDAMTGPKEEVTVMVDPPIPVHLVYLTAMVNANGELRFFEDLYGHDATLLAAFAARDHGRMDAPASVPASFATWAPLALATRMLPPHANRVDDLRQSVSAEYANSN